MKTLYIARHAKSDWSDSTLKDYDRPLNTRGKRDCKAFVPLVGKKISTLDLLMTSGAKRAKKTAKVRAGACDIAKKDVFDTDELYHASLQDLIGCIRTVESGIDSLMVIGHNPGLTDFIEWGGYPLSNLPTCGIVCFGYVGNDWNDLDPGLMSFQWYEYPKKYL